MSEIVLDRGEPTMELDNDERALLDEIEVDTRTFNMGGDNRPSRGQRSRFQQDDMIDDPGAFMNTEKRHVPPPNTGNTADDEPIDYGENNDDYDFGPRGTGPVEEMPSHGFSTIDDEKADILNKLNRVASKRGVRVNKNLNMYSDINDLRTELKRARYSIEVDQSVRFSKRMLVACVTGIEFLNKRYDPFDLKLDGWSESVMENADDYDEVFEELYVKYKSSVNVAPEIRLMMMVGGSGMMFHLSNSMFKSVMPNVNDVMRQNPDLMQNMMSAVQNTMSMDPAGLQRPPSPPLESGQRREMRGPGIDLSSLMGNMSMPQPPQPENTFKGDASVPPPPVPDDDMSDIVSVVSEHENVKDISVTGKKRRTRRKKADTSDKNEVSI